MLRDLAPCAGMAGVQLAWALQTAWATGLFVLQYGASIRSIGSIRIAGPLAGLLVQPIAGILSDRADRRTTLALGVALMTVGMLLLPNAHALLPPGPAFQVAVASLWALDIGMNVALLTMRAITASHFPARQQAHGQALLASAAGIGQLCGFALSTLSASRLSGGRVPAANDVGALFALGAVLLVGLTGVTLACATPSRATAPPVRAGASAVSAALVFDAFAFWSVPRWLVGPCLIALCSWLGWFTNVLLLAHWVGEALFEPAAAGAPPAQRARAYADGVSFAAAGSALQAAIAALTGAGALQWLLRVGGIRGAYAASLCAQAALSCATCAIGALRSPVLAKAGALCAIGLLGASWAATQTLPYAIVGERAPPGEAGVLLGKLNVYVVLAQIAVSLLLAPLSAALPAGAHACEAICAGGLCALAGLIFVPLVDATRAPPIERAVLVEPLLISPLVSQSDLWAVAVDPEEAAADAGLRQQDDESDRDTEHT